VTFAGGTLVVAGGAAGLTICGVMIRGGATGVDGGAGAPGLATEAGGFASVGGVVGRAGGVG
jgi:hypothetical protein